MLVVDLWYVVVVVGYKDVGGIIILYIWDLGVIICDYACYVICDYAVVGYFDVNLG